ncbi:MAG: hypothetical protein AAGI07_13070 [Bacteroidota bacterium]
MANEEKVYEAFGELLYAIARSEGKVKQATEEHVEMMLKKYTWGNEAIWSFKYEKKRKNSFEETYDHAISTFIEYGPFEEYKTFFELLDEIHQQKNSIFGERGKKILSNFKKKLQRAFMENENITYEDDDE